VATQGAASAPWASATSGSVQYPGYGWDFNVPSSPISGSNLTDARGGANLGASDWSYTFTATQDGQFTIDYSVTPNGNPFGLWGWQINCNCSNAGGPSLDAYDPTATGTFVGDIYAGGTYTVTLDGNPNVEFPFQAGNYSGSMDGLFSWSTTGDVAPIAGQLNVVANSSIGPAAPAVPEPAAWALMIGGFGLAGVALRRRRIVIA
ncbi:MAG: PEPxxWA-CTERM sorting domain-containing protein, partial [Phenylobacterium sp.]